jgi:hypothetical protein
LASTHVVLVDSTRVVLVLLLRQVSDLAKKTSPLSARKISEPTLEKAGGCGSSVASAHSATGKALLQ